MPVASPYSFAAPLALLQEGGGQGAPGFADMLPMLGIMFFIMWFMVIRPERKERRKREDMIAQLKKNDKVITSGGMYATVAAVGEKDLTLKFDDGPTRVRVVRSAIASVLTPEGSDDS